MKQWRRPGRASVELAAATSVLARKAQPARLLLRSNSHVTSCGSAISPINLDRLSRYEGTLLAPGRAYSVCARRSPHAAGDNAAVRSLRTSVSSTSVTVIAPGAGWSITSTATVSTTGATGCFTFRTAFLTERRDEQDKPKLPRVECLNGSIAAITIQRLKLRGEICGHVATLPNTMPSNHAASAAPERPRPGRLATL